VSAKSERCSPTEALELLMRGGLSAPAAAKRLTDAIHDPDICRLWCDCKLVKPHFAVRLMVEPRYDEDEGRWMARIVSAVGEAWEKPDKPVYKWGTKDELEAAPYDWKLDVDEVKALRPQPELERPWPTVSGSVNWTPPAILAPATPPEPDPTPEPSSPEIDRILEDLPRRPVGRPLKHDWQAIHAEIARRCIDPKTGRVKVPKSDRKLTQDMLKWCQDNNKEEPAESEMRDAVRAVSTALRPLQK